MATDTATAFDDRIHRLMQFGRIRPTDAHESEKFVQLLDELLQETDPVRHKLFVLAILFKRCHFLSPACKEDVDDNDTSNAGDGERDMFYRTIAHLARWPHSRAMAQTLIRAAPWVGGSRDLCAILILVLELCLTAEGTSFSSRTSCSAQVVEQLRVIKAAMDRDGTTAQQILKPLLKHMGSVLDDDFAIMKQAAFAGEAGGPTQNDPKLPSTLHIFLPHRCRGRVKKKNSTSVVQQQSTKRQCLNALAEIMIWRHTKVAQEEPAFVPCYTKLLQSKNTAADQKRTLGILQTITRKIRGKLNQYARAQGFMLTDQYVLDASQLSSTLVRRGKAGDISLLNKRATKKQDQRILNLLKTRNVVPYASVGEVMDATGSVTTTTPMSQDLQDVVTDLYRQRMAATIAKLRQKVKPERKSTLVVSMETSQTQQTAALLTHAALSAWSPPTDTDDPTTPKTDQELPNTTTRLMLSGTEHEVSNFEQFLRLIGEVVRGSIKASGIDAPSFQSNNALATAKSITNLLDRHAGESEVIVLLTGADVRLPEDTLRGLAERGVVLHLHDAGGMAARLQREGARQGDITISLAWDTLDDLDLHVTIPSGEELFYANRHSKDSLCQLDVDMNAGSPFSKEPVENVFLGNANERIQAPLGKYKVVVQNYGYHTSPPHQPVPFRVRLEMNGNKQLFEGVCRGTLQPSNVVACQFDYQGRTVPFPGDDVSALGEANVKSLTASIGSTVESLVQLVQVSQQVQHMETVESLMDVEDSAMDTPAMSTARVAANRWTVTSRDRLRIQLAQLPSRLHDLVNKEYGGPTLAELCAEELARRLGDDKIPLSELASSGYPSPIVEAVQAALKTNA